MHIALAVNLAPVGGLIRIVILTVVCADKHSPLKIRVLNVRVEEDALGLAIRSDLGGAREGAQEGVELWRRRRIAKLLKAQIIRSRSLDCLVAKVDSSRETPQAGPGAGVGAGAIPGSGRLLKGAGAGNHRGEFAKELACVGGVLGPDEVVVEGTPDE